MQGMFDDVTVTAIRTFYDESQLTANYTISQRGPYCAHAEKLLPKQRLISSRKYIYLFHTTSQVS